MAAEQVEAVRPDGAEVEEVVADKGYHSDATLVALDEIGVRSYVSEPERGRRCWQDKKTGETPAEKPCCAEGTIWEPSAYSRRPRSSSSTPPRGAGGAAFRAPVRDRGAAAGVGARPRECAQAGAHPGGRLQPRTAAAPPDRRRHAPEPAGAGSFGHLRTDRAPDRALGASDGLLGLPMDASGAGRLNRSSPSCLNKVGSANRLLPRAASAGVLPRPPSFKLIHYRTIHTIDGVGTSEYGRDYRVGYGLPGAQARQPRSGTRRRRRAAGNANLPKPRRHRRDSKTESWDELSSTGRNTNRWRPPRPAAIAKAIADGLGVPGRPSTQALRQGPGRGAEPGTLTGYQRRSEGPTSDDEVENTPNKGR